MMGQQGSGLAADGDGSGTVDNGDYGFWRARVGSTAASGAISGAVPEPTTAGVVGSAIAVLFALSRSRRS
jgi:hypothetical protein